jgi:hypothetical protein
MNFSLVLMSDIILYYLALDNETVWTYLPEDRGIRFLRNVDIQLLLQKVSHPM